MVLAGVIIFGGIKRIARTAELIVPVMALAYWHWRCLCVYEPDKTASGVALIFKVPSAYKKQRQVALAMPSPKR